MGTIVEWITYFVLVFQDFFSWLGSNFIVTGVSILGIFIGFGLIFLLEDYFVPKG